MTRFTVNQAAVDVVPDARGFDTKLRRDLAKVNPKVQVGVEVDRAELAKAEAEVRASAAKLSKARDAEEASAAKVAIAEARLAEVRAKSAAGSARPLAAEEKLRLAKVASAAASRETEKAVIAEEAANKRLLAAKGAVEKSLTKRSGRQSFQFDIDVDTPKLAALVTNLGKASAAAAALGAATKGVAGLGQILASASGAAGLIPAAMAAGATAAGALKLATVGVGDALTAVAEGDAKKLDKAMAKLSPKAREFIGAAQSIRAAWQGVQSEVQDRLFSGLSTELKGLSSTYLPSVREGFDRVITGANLAAVTTSTWLRSAEGTAKIKPLLQNSSTAARDLGRSVQPIVAMFTTIASVGSGFLPSLANSFSDAAAKANNFVNNAAKTGQLRQWIQDGINTLEQFGRIAGDVGGILSGVFRAAGADGKSYLDTVETITQRTRDWVASAQGSEKLRGIFDSLNDAGRILGGWIRDVAVGSGPALQSFVATLPQIAQAFVDLMRAAAPFHEVVLALATHVLPGLASAISLVATNTGPLLSGILALVVAAKGFALWDAYTAKVGKFADAAGGLAGRVTGSEAAATRFTSAVSRMGSALPIIGAGLVAVTAAYEEFGSKADQNAAKIIDGSQTLQQAIAAEQAQLERNTLWWNSASEKQRAYSEVADEVTAKFHEQYAALTPLQQVQAAAAMAQTAYTQAVRDFGANSPQATAAAAILSDATMRAKDAQQQAADATKSHTDRMREQQDQALAMANADVAYRQSLLDRKAAQDAAAASVRQHGINSDEATRAQLALEQADLRVVAAADQLASSNTNLTSSEDKAQYATLLHNNAVLGLAAGLNGPASQAMIDMAAKMDDNALRTHNAAVQTSGFDFTVRSLPDGRKVNVWTDDAVRSMNQTSDFHKTLDNLPKFVTVSIQTNGVWGVIQGQVANAGAAIQSTVGAAAAAAGRAGRAGGGVLDSTSGVLPGYTPGRDVHSFLGPTGRIDLSGGEAIMRPEFTRAVGTGWIDQMNAAARTGGTSAVAARLGIPTHAFASGGVVDGAHLPAAAVNAHQGAVAAFAADAAAKWKKYNDEVMAGAAGGGGGAGVQRWSSVVLQALAMLGQPASYLGITLRRMNQESGGNPRAINLWDSNAKKGIPSKGLMQVIDPTFNANWDARTPKDIWNPLSNIVASMRYALRRYGSLPAAYNKAGGYDSGGELLPGATLAINKLPHSETVIPLPPNVVGDLLAVGAGQGEGGDTYVIYPSAPLDEVATAREVSRLRAFNRRVAV